MKKALKRLGIIFGCYIAVLYTGVMLDTGLTTLNQIERVEPTGLEAFFIAASHILQYPFALIRDASIPARFLLNVANGLLWTFAVYGLVMLVHVFTERQSRGIDRDY